MSPDPNQASSAPAVDQTTQSPTAAATPAKTGDENSLAALEELIQQAQQRTKGQGEAVEQAGPSAESSDEPSLDFAPSEPQKTLEEIEQLRQVKELETQQQIKQQQAAIQENIATAPEIQKRTEARQEEAKAREVEAVVDNMEIRQLSHTKINK